MDLPGLCPKSVAISAGAVILIGFWLMVSPWILPGAFPFAAIASDECSGAGLVLLALGQAILWRSMLPSWIATAICIWIIFAPWICGYADRAAPLRNDVAAGVTAVIAVTAMLITVFSLQELARYQQTGTVSS